MALLDELGIREGMTAVVGAGGKKSLIYYAANRLDRAVITATVRIPIFDDVVEARFLTHDPARALDGIEEWPVGVVPARAGDRYLGYEPSVLDELRRHRGSAPILVKADGARTREFKAPGADEPVVPGRADTVVAVASVSAVGRPLDETTVHRPERVAALTGRRMGEAITPTDVATVLASERGGRKNVPEAGTFLPVLNKVDDERAEAIAEETAARLLETAPVERVLLTSLIDAADPLVDVIR